MKTVLSYGFAALAVLSFLFIIHGFLGLYIAMFFACVITFFWFNKLFPVPPKK